VHELLALLAHRPPPHLDPPHTHTCACAHFPRSIPTAAAIKNARVIVERLLERQRQDLGAYPETIAVVLWGTDNIKTYGESLAQVRPSVRVSKCAFHSSWPTVLICCVGLVSRCA
jgi:hypothetical protein